MGFLSNIARWFNNSPAQDAFEDATEEWNEKNGDKGIGPYTQARDDWRKRLGQCSGSGTPANFIMMRGTHKPYGSERKKRVGTCQVCKKDNLAVTKKGMTWPHKRPAKPTLA